MKWKPYLMSKSAHEIWTVGLLTGATLGLVALAYTISKLPEEEFVRRMETTQMNFEEFSTFDEALAAIKAEEEKFLTSEILLTSERGDVVLTAATLGVTADDDELIQTLGNFMEFATPISKVEVYLFGKTLKLPSSVNEEQTKLAFEGSGIEQGVKDAEYFYEAGVQIAEEQIGYGIAAAALTAELQTAWETFTPPAELALPLRTAEPEIRTEDLETLLPQAEGIAAQSFTLEDEFSNSWEFPMAAHLNLLKPSAEDPALLKIDEDAFITAIELELVPEVEEDPLPAIITENEDGTYAFHGSARFGREIDKTGLLALIEDNLDVAADDEGEAVDLTITLPIRQVEPQVTVPASLREKGITELVGMGYSNFSGSRSGRIHNVNRGMDQFNGVIVEQGAEFSFTSLVGEIDAANGWLPEYVIKGDETIPEYGGGLCQVSSTMFRAALYSGLSITMRKNHSYAVSTYAYPSGYGLDATVYTPLPDFRFINDTAGALLIQGYTEGENAYFVFYGTYDGRTVAMDGPYNYDYVAAPDPVTVYTETLEPGIRELKDRSHTGFKVDWYRIITYGDGTQSERENIHSNYEARPARYEEGMPESGIPPTEEEVGG